ncbi:hypothetical protein L198_04310 [Cryptococcus wingfieldii CBS 7118]|uniref:Reverse transcriptase n=1 Tax=Cryptococcus wingfieldii CBS 7118 TaxID=1295528 RepID=A0A1E3J4B9_9TREE|nr:hypothetical protein L198_04310 [Cryptococcus wingfieldii CBS 7118]ODN95692.1 hypothetical protein L198_04310 [Cryptococcus wingfieldii CBS 7118]
MDVYVGNTIYRDSPFVVMPLGPANRMILGLPFHLQHRLLAGASGLEALLEEGRATRRREQDGEVVVGSGLARISEVSLELASELVTRRKELTAQLLTDFADILPPQLTDVASYPKPAPSVSQVRHHINVLPNTKPVARPYYRLPLVFGSAFKAEIDKHVDAGRLRTSSSPWAAPAFLIQKENGKL